MIKVYFDGVCGLCSKEIAHYKMIANEGIFEWIDVARNPNALIDHNVTQYDALLYLRLVDNKNRMHIGAEAFAVIWKHLPKWKYMGYAISLPVIKTFAKYIYIWGAKRRFNRYTHCQLAKQKF